MEMGTLESKAARNTSGRLVVFFLSVIAASALAVAFWFLVTPRVGMAPWQLAVLPAAAAGGLIGKLGHVAQTSRLSVFLAVGAVAALSACVGEWTRATVDFQAAMVRSRDAAAEKQLHQLLQAKVAEHQRKGRKEKEGEPDEREPVEEKPDKRADAPADVENEERPPAEPAPPIDFIAAAPIAFRLYLEDLGGNALGLGGSLLLSIAAGLQAARMAGRRSPDPP